jgi:hypothetical protein
VTDSFLQRIDEVVLSSVPLQSLNAGDIVSFELNDEPIHEDSEPFFFGIFQ